MVIYNVKVDTARLLEDEDCDMRYKRYELDLGSNSAYYTVWSILNESGYYEMLSEDDRITNLLINMDFIISDEGGRF